MTLITLFYRLSKLLVLSVGTLPGVLLFWPVFVTTKVISEKKRRLALAASVVKLQGHFFWPEAVVNLPCSRSSITILVKVLGQRHAISPLVELSKTRGETIDARG